MDNDRLPIIEREMIGPNKGKPADEVNSRKERHLRKDSLASFILEWWRGDAHTHSQESTRPGFNYVEGIYYLREIAAYYEKLGLKFVCLAEHASKPGNPTRQAPESPICQSLLRETDRIYEYNREHTSEIVILSGVEVNIFYDEDHPALDIPDEVLKKVDLIIASRHAIAREKEPAAIKESLLFAARHPHIDVIGHPDRYTREDGSQSEEYWQEYWSIWPEILEEMAKHGKAFEINLNNPPAERIIEEAIRAGVKFFINYDAHGFGQYIWEQTELTKKGGEAMNRWARGELQRGDLEILKEYKVKRLTGGPGVLAILRLTKWIKFLQYFGVKPEGVVNSSKERLLRFLTEERQKRTANLDYLISR